MNPCGSRCLAGSLWIKKVSMMVWAGALWIGGVGENAADPVGGSGLGLRSGGTFSDAQWLSMGGRPAANGSVHAIATDTVNGITYVGGGFTQIGNAVANRIAAWDGETWSALGSGVEGGSVNALTVDGTGNLYVGGLFSSAGGNTNCKYVAKWSGGTWTNLGTGYSYGEVFALAVDGAGNLYAGGGITYVGGVAASGVAKWNGTAWSALGSGVAGIVQAMVHDGASTLYVGGVFTTAGGSPANRVAKWNGTSWSSLGTGFSQPVRALRLSGYSLFAGGTFTSAGGSPGNRVARWNGTSWSALGTGTDSDVYTLAVGTDGTLYAGGSFDMAGGVSAKRIAAWNGSTWSPLGSGIAGGSSVQALATDAAGRLWAGGNFLQAGELAGQGMNVATWEAGQWHVVGTGFDSSVLSMVLDGAGGVVAGGYFRIAGGAAVSRVARWTGSAWTALGTGPNNSVKAVAVDGAGNVYAGGSFTAAGTTPANRVAKWDGSQWLALGDGLNNDVEALATDADGNLYAGGWFTAAGAVGVSRVAKWNGTTWSSLGSGVNSTVYALAVDENGHLIAGGGFSTAGGVSVSRVARWDGNAWSAIGSGISGGVYELALADNGLYAVGWFPSIGANSNCRYIARWDGSSWLNVGSGVGGSAANVTSIALAPSGDVYVGGWFTEAGGNTNASYIARWNGSEWQALGSGVDSGVESLVLNNEGRLFVGGSFTRAGLQSVGCAAMALTAFGSLVVSGTDASTIANGDNTPSITDGTDFDVALVSGGTVERTFSLSNAGAAPLAVSAVSLSGPNTNDFSVVSHPSTVAPGANAPLVVRFDPIASGVRIATVVIHNDDPSQSTYSFGVSGVGSPERIAIFYNPSYVDTSASSSGEAHVLRQALLAKGYAVESFAGVDVTAIETALDDADVLVIPELELASLAPALLTDARNVIRSFVESGRGLILLGHSGGRDVDLFNAVFGTSAVASGTTTVGASKTQAALGTTFDDGPASLPALDATSPWRTSMLPPGALSLYEVEHSGVLHSHVSILSQGYGVVVVLAFDWFNAVPVGTQDGGWDEMLSRAVNQACLGGYELDGDGDGLPNGWEMLHVGTPTGANPNSMAASGVHTLLEAYTADLSPSDPSAVYPSTLLTPSSPGSLTVVVAPTSPNRIYGLRWSQDPSTDPSLWPILPPEKPGTGAAVEFSVPTENVAGFFRTSVRLP